jgi:hypothetical protein
VGDTQPLIYAGPGNPGFRSYSPEKGTREAGMAGTTKLSVEKALNKIREADMEKPETTLMDREIAELDEATKRMRAERLRLERLQRRSTKAE